MPGQAAMEQFLGLVDEHRNEKVVKAVSVCRDSGFLNRTEVPEAIRKSQQVQKRNRRKLRANNYAQRTDVDTADK